VPNSDPSLQHLQIELTRLDILLHREVRRWQQAGQDATDAFRGQYVSDDEANALLKRSFGTSWGQTVAESKQEQQAYAKALAQVEQQREAVIQTAQSQGHQLRLLHLAETFGLNQFELDTLLVCLAPTLDLSYERLYGYLQDDVTRRRPNVNLVLDLLVEPGLPKLNRLAHFADNAPLFKYNLLEKVTEAGPAKLPLLAQTLHVDDAIVAWLLGTYQSHADLGEHAILSQPQASETDKLLAGEVQTELPPLANTDQPPLVIFYGPDQAGQRAAIRLLAAETEQPLLTVNMAAVIEAEISPLRAVRLALRDARLTGAILALTSSKAWEDQGHIPPDILAELCPHPNLVIIAGQTRLQAGGIERDRQFVWLEFPIPTYSQRRALWLHFLGQDVSLDSLNLADLTGQFILTTGQIRDAVATAKDIAAQHHEPLQDEHLFAAARAQSSSRLAVLARKIEPRYDWLDIILPDDQRTILNEMIDTVRGRPLVLDEWGVGQKLASSSGVTALFAGSPGTGKTMAAEVIARELGLDLYKIDLSSIISKYIGETEKNLEKIFREAESSNAILFFDEADAIFGKRSEVRDSHDRYANIEISYLLQRMETYAGVTILATNLRANLDEAFTRRLQFVIDFPFPEEEYRLHIWQALFPPDVPHDPEIDFDLLARRFKLAGGNIRNIIVNATYLAAADGQAVTMEHLLHGTRRELQKMGRLIPESDLTISKG
jgi:AAA+ superfamily predicted ATPase